MFSSPVYAQTKDWSLINANCLSGDVATLTGLECLFFNLLSIASSVAGLAFFIMFIVGGFRYLFSGGDQKKVAGAGATLTHAILGLVLSIAVWIILKFIQTFTGINVTEFKVGP